tara:strand:+ start:712 stop:1914 length:1203 start_codon:yes stop_codon:yes gene_type:complete
MNDTPNLPYFKIDSSEHDNLSARTGTLITSHGEIPTPAFFPVATQGTVKSLSSSDITEIGYKAFISNAYHLSLRPGIDSIKSLGGLHEFINWEGSIATDSGGFQIASLAKNIQISDEAVTFRSHIDGSLKHISPELSIRIQEELGADIIMAFDQPISYGAEKPDIQIGMQRTHDWLIRSIAAHSGTSLLYGIIQGGTYRDLRTESANFINSVKGIQGIAIGGLSLGEPKSVLWEMVEVSADLTSYHMPRHLLGVGSPEDLVEGVGKGIDTFDCVLPTRVARKGSLYTQFGRINITNSKYRVSNQAISSTCVCYTCNNYSLGYLNHLFKANELLAYRLGTIHNLTFIYTLMEDLRVSISTGNYIDYKNNFLDSYQSVDESVRSEQKRLWAIKQDQKKQDFE